MSCAGRGGPFLVHAGHTRKIFLNLPVRDLRRAIDFFTALGFAFNPRFTDDHASCMIVGEDAHVMLLSEERFRDFVRRRRICDTRTHTEALIAFSAASRGEVDRIADAAIAAGGAHAADPLDHGFMYCRSFHDLDGHHWEVLWMDPGPLPN